MTNAEMLGRPRRCCRSVKGDPRPRTISPKALERWHREPDRQAEEGVEFVRPATRADCRRLPRPCPFVGCRHHLFLDVKPTGAVTVSWPHLEPWEIPESCALDVAECGEHTLDEVGALLNVSRERIRKLEMQALDRLRTNHGRALAQHRTWGRREAPQRATAEQPAPAASGLVGPAVAPLRAHRAEVG